jgi:hypothetical protein
MNDGIKTAQPRAIDGRIINFNKATPKELDRDHSKVWSLGHDFLKETHEYKYLGVYFPRSLSFNYHINCYLKDNVEIKYNNHKTSR